MSFGESVRTVQEIGLSQTNQKSDLSVTTDIDEKDVVNIDRLECILKKCSNVKTIDCKYVLVNDQVMNVITDYCQRLIEIHFVMNDVTEEAIIRFGEKLGHKLRHIHIHKDDSSLENQQINCLIFVPILHQ